MSYKHIMYRSRNILLSCINHILSLFLKCQVHVKTIVLLVMINHKILKYYIFGTTGTNINYVKF